MFIKVTRSIKVPPNAEQRSPISSSGAEAVSLFFQESFGYELTPGIYQVLGDEKSQLAKVDAVVIAVAPMR